MKRLTLLNGQVKNLKIRQVTKSVFASNAPQKLAEAGALTAAALGSVYASSVMASSRLKMTQEVELFSCEVNGVKLVGCFGEVTFMNNHNLEFVVEYIDEEKTEAVAHAARNVQKKVIWVSPYQSEGETVNRKGVNKIIFWVFIILIVFMLCMTIFSFLTDDTFDAISMAKVWGSVLLLYPFFALLFKLIARVEVKDAMQATEIFFAFGYEYPSEVSLDDNSWWVTMEEEERTGKRLPQLPQWIFRYHDDDLKKPTYPATLRNVHKRDKELKEKYGTAKPSGGVG